MEGSRLGAADYPLTLWSVNDWSGYDTSEAEHQQPYETGLEVPLLDHSACQGVSGDEEGSDSISEHSSISSGAKS